MTGWQLAQWTLDWRYGQAELTSLGGMLGPVTFRLNDGRSLQAMHVAPWMDDPALPGLMRALRGEWPCVPFGRTDVPAGLAAENWQVNPPAPQSCPDVWPHGYGANHQWACLSSDRGHVRLGLDYPDSSAIERMERQITADPDLPALDLSLTIWPRRDAILPVALHPTFRVPQDDGVTLKPGTFSRAIAYPIPAEANVSRLRPGGISADLSAMPAISGTLDLTHLPLEGRTEELLQLMDCAPPFSLHYDREDVELSLWWDQQKLPDVMLWISNGGRSAYPWAGRNYALGIEPLNGAFDLGRVAAPPADHPLAVRRGLALKKDRPMRIDYRLMAR